MRGCPYHGLVPVPTQWRCFLQRAYIGAFNIQYNEKSKTKKSKRKVINKENKRNDNDDDDDDDDDDDKNKMVESPPELFLQLAEQAEICRTSCDPPKSCPDGKGKFTQYIVSARG